MLLDKQDKPLLRNYLYATLTRGNMTSCASDQRLK